ncbi:MAG: hypothetical protein MK108_14530 [Mariniblastus sp.]|nr:hypothetical protein [Mariniblastus sp.]
MDIDIYQQCPIHTDKKIKFCCGKGIGQELDQILAKNKSKQTKSAVDQIDRLIEKVGPRELLLVLKTHMLISKGDLEAARKSNEAFLEMIPGHPMGKQHQALILLGEADIPGGLAALQDSMDGIKGNEIPIAVANVFRMLGAALLQQGHVLAARAHLQFAQMIKGEPDQQLQQLLYESYRLQGGPLLLKADYRLQQPPEGAEWEKKYLNVQRAMNRGQFRMALRILDKIDEHWPGEPVVVRSMAILTCILADVDQMAAAWRRLAELDSVPHWEAVEAEALAQLFSPQEEEDMLDVVRLSWELQDVDRAFEIADGAPFVVGTQAPEADPFGEGPAPRHAWIVLDRDALESAEGVTLDQLPVVRGELMVFGKQTDRSARLVLVGAETEGFETVRQQVDKAFSEVTEGEAEREVVASTSRAAEALSWNWHVPVGMTREQHADLVRQQRTEQLLQTWADLPFHRLGGKTPREAAGQAELAIPLQAMVLQLEQTAQSQSGDDAHIVALRDELGMDQPELIDGPRLETEFVSPLRQRYLDFSSLSDEQLIGLQGDAMAMGNLAVLKQAIPEILERDSLREQVPPQACYSMMARLVEDDQEGLDYLAKARQAARQAEEPVGTYLVQEFEFRLSRGLSDKLPELLQTIQQKHLREPNVEYQLAYILEKFGLISADGRGPGESPAAPPPEMAGSGTETEGSGSAIWTPDDPGSAPEAPEASPESGDSKLWLPDS